MQCATKCANEGKLPLAAYLSLGDRLIKLLLLMSAYRGNRSLLGEGGEPTYICIYICRFLATSSPPSRVRNLCSLSVSNLPVLHRDSERERRASERVSELGLQLGGERRRSGRRAPLCGIYEFQRHHVEAAAAAAVDTA